MAKILNNYKIEVEDYTENDNGKLICQCYVPEIEGNCFGIEVSIADFSDALCSENNGIVETSLNRNGDTVTFYEWYDENKLSPKMCNILADYINKIEKRIDYTTNPLQIISVNQYQQRRA